MALLEQIKVTPKSSAIYQIVCAANGRRYVGSAVNLRKRWSEHFRQLSNGRHHSQHMQRSWNKHGQESFAFSVIENCEREMLIEREQFHIDSMAPEFNTSPTAGSQLGYRHTPETRKKMSHSRPKDFSPMTGKQHTDETKRRISATKTGRRFGSYNKARVEAAAAAMRASKSSITPDDVRKIRALKANGLPHAAVAQSIGCSYSVVADISRNRTYTWVD